jgi:plastocyanin
MSRLHTGCTALLALAFVGACGTDSPRSEVVAPNSSGDAAFSSGSDNGDDDDVNDGSGNKTIAMRDDCDPRDQAAWAPTGGCLLRRGDVTFAEFNAENNSPLAAAVVGHMAWRMDPTYLKLRTGKTVRIRNAGGRAHTFTEVAMFGGGKVPSPDLNKGLVTAPECPGSTNIAPGGRTEVSGLTVGNHRFQCCIHPWMRTIIKVKAHENHADD